MNNKNPLPLVLSGLAFVAALVAFVVYQEARPIPKKPYSSGIRYVCSHGHQTVEETVRMEDDRIFYLSADAGDCPLTQEEEMQAIKDRLSKLENPEAITIIGPSPSDFPPVIADIYKINESPWVLGKCRYDISSKVFLKDIIGPGDLMERVVVKNFKKECRRY